jgi:dihydrofolate synthase/folylpolyglutamate synthase
MRFETLSGWLEWQSGLHPEAIELGLDRVTAVAARMTPRPKATRVITVGGTNGKGSTVRMLESILIAGGYRVGAYTSPHVERYNERVRIDGEAVPDAALCGAFERVGAARGEVALTYFEFGTLAALDLFWRTRLDVAVLEVGLGGRLDAVNIVDADCAVVTNIALDHLEWLGPDRESIGAEKAGIFRAGRPAVCADRDPPRSLVARASTVGAVLRRVGRDYDYAVFPAGNDASNAGRWQLKCPGSALEDTTLPPPALAGEHQYANAAAALAALDRLAEVVPVARQAVIDGLAGVRLPGRFELMPGPPATILDVAHNPAAARALCAELGRTRRPGHTFAVIGMRADKAIDEVAAILAPEVGAWVAVDLPGPRGLEAVELARRVRLVTSRAAVSTADSPREGWRRAAAVAGSDDRIVVCGSFLTVADVRSALCGGVE